MKKSFFTLCILISFSFVSLAQNKKVYIIRILNAKSEVYKGIFQSINNNELDLINNKGETVRFTANQVKSIKIWRKGAVLNSAFLGVGIGAALFSVALLSIPEGSFFDLSTRDSILLGTAIGLPYGGTAGSLAGVIFKSKIKYPDLNLQDFSIIQKKLVTYSVAN